MSAPRWLTGLLSRVVPEDRQDDVIGDLEELHRRRLRRHGTAVAWAATVAEGSWLVFRFAVRSSAKAAVGAGGWVSGVELRLALRLVRNQPVMTITSVVALGVGIGIVAGAFSVFHQGLYGDLPFPNGERWVNIESYSEETGRRTPVDLERLKLFRESAPALEYIAGSESGDFNLRHRGGEIERVSGAYVTPGIFRYLPYQPLAGRLLGVADGKPATEPVVLIRESLWERRFGRDPGVMGGTLVVAGSSHVVVGVLPNEAKYPSEGEIWMPLAEETLGAVDGRRPVGSRFVGILAEGAAPEQAERQLSQLSSRVSDAGRGATRLRFRVQGLTRVFVGPQMYVMISAFMVVLTSILLIIAANVGNLVVARTSRRSSELAVRTALGASRSRIVGQLFLEMLVIGGLAGVLGLAAAAGILRLYDRVLDELPFWVDLHLAPSTGVLVVLLALLATCVTGVLPALRATRKGPAASLRSSGRGASLAVGRVGGAMIAAEVALSVALLGSALLFTQGLRSYVGPAFDLPDERVLTARIAMDLDETDLRTGGASTVADSMARVLSALERSIASTPGATAVGLVSNLPRTSPYPELVEVEERPDRRAVPLVGATPGLFAALNIRPRLGRPLEERDFGPEAPPVVVANEAFATERFGTTQIVGRRVRFIRTLNDADPAPWREIVGVVPDFIEVTGADGGAGLYYPLRPGRFTSVAVQVAGEPAAFAGALRRAAYDVDPNLNISEVVRLDEVGAENRRALVVLSSGLTGIGLITLLLSLAGVYSIVSLAVSQRTREIGVRVALGAAPRRVLLSVLGRSTLLVSGGSIAGAIAGSWISSLDLFVFAVPEARWWLFPGLVGTMALAGALACWVPARRALSVQPVEALRYDS